MTYYLIDGERMKRTCSECKHYDRQSYLYADGCRNVSGGLALGRRWLEPMCDIGIGKFMISDNCPFYESQYRCLLETAPQKPRVVPAVKMTEEMVETARWHNSDCGKLNGGRRCTCACGWAKIVGRYGCSWWKFLMVC